MKTKYRLLAYHINMNKVVTAIFLFTFAACSKKNIKGQYSRPIDRYHIDVSMKAPIFDASGNIDWRYEFLYKSDRDECVKYYEDTAGLKIVAYIDSIPVVTWEWEAKKFFNGQNATSWIYGSYMMTEQGPTQDMWLKGKLTILNQARQYDTVKLDRHSAAQVYFFDGDDVVSLGFYVAPDYSYDSSGMAISGNFWFPKKNVTSLRNQRN